MWLILATGTIWPDAGVYGYHFDESTAKMNHWKFKTDIHALYYIL